MLKDCADYGVQIRQTVIRSGFERLNSSYAHYEQEKKTRNLSDYLKMEVEDDSAMSGHLFFPSLTVCI